MAQVLIRNLDEKVVETYRRRASERGLSLEAALRDALTHGAELNGEERAAIVRRTLEANDKLINHDTPQTPGWILIREDRDDPDR